MALTYLPDIIVCDVLMPGMNGHEVLHYLLLTPITSKIPFIFSSSFSERIDKTEALAMGADEYLIKPFEPETLLVSIKTLIKNGSKRKIQELSIH
jgi:CheY-like chemotaxis protein